MGYKSFDRRWKERRAYERDVFRHRFDTPAKVAEFVDELGCQADERLPGLYERREQQRANVEVLRVVGGEPLERAENALWETNHDIEYYEPWQMLRDCLAAKLLTIDITTLYVQFEVAGYRNRRICRFGPHNGLEFGQTGQRRQLSELAKTARALLRYRGTSHPLYFGRLRDGREIVVNPQARSITMLDEERHQAIVVITEVPTEVIERIHAGYEPENWEEVRRLSRPTEHRT